MDSQEIDLMDKAYNRRKELVEDPETSWVRMNMDKYGVTLTVCGKDNSKRVEFIGREPAHEPD